MPLSQAYLQERDGDGEDEGGAAVKRQGTAGRAVKPKWQRVADGAWAIRRLVCGGTVGVLRG